MEKTMELERKSIFLKVFLFMIVGTILVFSHSRCDSDHITSEEDFAVKDTSNIIKFRISDTENHSITITRENTDGIWMIEGSDYLVQNYNVQLILETFYRIKVKQDISKSGVENVISSLAVR